MVTSFILIILFSLPCFPHANSFHLGEFRYSRSSEKNDKNLISTEVKKEKLHLDGQNEEASRRDSSRLFGNQGSFIKCTFEFHDNGKPEYKCDHSGDVKINWREEKGRLIGTFTTNFHCPRKRDVIDRISRNKSDAKVKSLNYVRREKRRNIFKDDAEYKDSEYDEQVDEEESIAPENVRQALWDDDTAEETQPAEAPIDEEEVTAVDNPEASITEPENDKDNDNSGTATQTEEGEKQPEPTEVEQENPAPDVPTEETSPVVPDDKPDNIDAASNVTDDDDEKPFDEDVQAGLILIDVELDKLLPDGEQVVQFITDVGNIIYDTGDYIISQVLGILKRRLRISRIHERFDEKVDKLAKKYGDDTAKALRIMEKRIHNRLGKGYEFEIVKFLIELRDGMKT